MYRCSVYIIFFDVDMWIGQICYSDSVHKSGEVLLRSVCGQAVRRDQATNRTDGHRRTNKRTNQGILLFIFQPQHWSSSFFSSATHPKQPEGLSPLTYISPLDVWGTFRSLATSSIDSHFRHIYFIYSQFEINLIMEFQNVSNQTMTVFLWKDWDELLQRKGINWKGKGSDRMSHRIFQNGSKFVWNSILC